MRSRGATTMVLEPWVEHDGEAVGGSGAASPMLVGQVLETTSPDYPGRVKIRWESTDGIAREGWLAVVRGLELAESDTVLLQRPANGSDWLVTQAMASECDIPGGRTSLDARVDGKRITIEGRDEIVLKCGDASITLRRNGRLVIRGTYVEARSRGTNRIKGASVLIN